MKTLYSNGDSFVLGMECIADFSTVETNKEYAFAKHVADGLRCSTYINNAYNGATNDFIFRNTIFDLLKLEKQGIKPNDVCVLIGWTALHRFEIYGPAWYSKVPNYQEHLTSGQMPEFTDHKSLFVNPSSKVFLHTPQASYDTHKDVLPFCIDFIWHDHLQIPQQEARILALHEFLKSRGYPHLFVNTCDSFQSDVLCTNTLNFYQCPIESFYKWAVELYPLEQRANNHFSPVPHAAYGKLLLDYAVKNMLY